MNSFSLGPKNSERIQFNQIHIQIEHTNFSREKKNENISIQTLIQKRTIKTSCERVKKTECTNSQSQFRIEPFLEHKNREHEHSDMSARSE